jgi:hypothetical protein
MPCEVSIYNYHWRPGIACWKRGSAANWTTGNSASNPAALPTLSINLMERGVNPAPEAKKLLTKLQNNKWISTGKSCDHEHEPCQVLANPAHSALIRTRPLEKDPDQKITDLMADPGLAPVFLSLVCPFLVDITGQHLPILNTSADHVLSAGNYHKVPVSSTGIEHSIKIKQSNI